MQPTTVEVTGYTGDIIFLNCGSIVQTAGTTLIMIDGDMLSIRGILHDPVGAAQKFADLLSDVTE